MNAFHPGTVEKELEEYAFADYIAVPTRIAVESFVRHGVPRAKLIQVPYGVDLDRFKPAPRADCAFRVLFVGALSIQKGVHRLLEACASLAKLPGFELLLVGSVHREIKPFLRKYEGTYRLAGTLPHSGLPAVYRSAALFVLPSLQEGLAGVQIEALACGVPVICSRATGCEEVFSNGKEGLILDDASPMKIREAIERYYGDRQALESMRQAILSRPSFDWSWERYGAQISAAYQGAVQILKDGRIPRRSEARR